MQFLFWFLSSRWQGASGSATKMHRAHEPDTSQQTERIAKVYAVPGSFFLSLGNERRTGQSGGPQKGEVRWSLSCCLLRFPSSGSSIGRRSIRKLRYFFLSSSCVQPACFFSLGTFSLAFLTHGSLSWSHLPAVFWCALFVTLRVRCFVSPLGENLCKTNARWLHLQLWLEIGMMSDALTASTPARSEAFLLGRVWVLSWWAFF